MTKYSEISNKNSEAIKITRSLLLGCAVGVAVSAALLSLSAVIFVKFGSLPVDYLSLITTFIGAFAAFAAGYSAVRLYRKRGLLIGVCAGAFLFLLVFITGLAKGIENDLIGSLIKLGVFAVMGAIGGVVSVNKKTKVKRY